MLRICVILACVCLFVIVHTQNDVTVVKTNTGIVHGLINKTLRNSNLYKSFLGIPYAKPPVEKFRFMPPVPSDPWTDPLKAFKYGAPCAQRRRSTNTTSEDCLFLNIFVPVLSEIKKLPVLIWIHGGLFASGSGSSDDAYGSDFMMEKEIILVTLNYRLGMLGFLSVDHYGYSGNMGLKDQQLAMKWIFDNIEFFGGNCSEITLGGQSAGSKSVTFHMLNEESRRYFHKALVMSGTAIKANGYSHGNHQCLLDAFVSQYATECVNNTEKLIDFLQKVEVEKIIEFTTNTIFGPDSPWIPVNEVDNAIRPFLRESPLTAFQKLSIIDKPTYFTFTHYENKYFTNRHYRTPAVIDDFLKDFYFDFPINEYNSEIEKQSYLKDLMIQVKNLYFNNSNTHEEKLRQRHIMDTDLHWNHPMEKWMEKHVAISTKETYYHRFSAVTGLNPTQKHFRGATHKDDLCYIFCCPQHINYYIDVFQNKNKSHHYTKTLKTMENMQTMITNFVKYGKPAINENPVAFEPVTSTMPDEFFFVDVTEDGLVTGIGPNKNRIPFIDSIVEEAEKRVNAHGDAPKLTIIQQLCNRKNFTHVDNHC